MFQYKVFLSIKKAILFLVFIQTTAVLAGIPDQVHRDSRSEYSQFWFLYEKEKRDGETELTIRPFYSSYHDKYRNYRQKSVLWPIYFSQKTDNWYYWTFLYIFSGTSVRHPDTGYDKDFIISPLFVWGRGETPRDKYYGFFPLFGKVKSKVSWSEIRYFLFPLYASWEYKDFKAYSFIWPLMLYGKSATRYEFRILPLFSIKKKYGQYERYSVLWPFIQWGKILQDKKEPVSFGFFFPFYAWKKSAYGNMRSYSVLWPLFSYGYDKRTGEKNLNAFFFLYQYGYSREKDYYKHIIFPFYGYYRFAGKQTRFITPFYINLKSDTSHMKTNYTFLVPFFWKMKRYFPHLDSEDVYYKLWPLFRYHRSPDGEVSWNFLSLLPVRSEKGEKIWDPIWSIMEYKKLVNGEKRLSLFMRLYTQRWSKDELHIHVPLLFDYSKTPEMFRWRIFYGLLGYERINGKRKFQVFWIKI